MISYVVWIRVYVKSLTLNTTIEYQVQAVKGKNKMKLRVVNLESDDDEPTPPPRVDMPGIPKTLSTGPGASLAADGIDMHISKPSSRNQQDTTPTKAKPELPSNTAQEPLPKTLSSGPGTSCSSAKRENITCTTHFSRMLKNFFHRITPHTTRKSLENQCSNTDSILT